MHYHLMGTETVLLIRKHPVAELNYNVHALTQFHYRSEIIQHCYRYNKKIMQRQ